MERVRVMYKHCYILHKVLEMHRFCHLKGVVEPVHPRTPSDAPPSIPKYVCLCVQAYMYLIGFDPLENPDKYRFVSQDSMKY